MLTIDPGAGMGARMAQPTKIVAHMDAAVIRRLNPLSPGIFVIFWGISAPMRAMKKSLDPLAFLR